MYFNISFLAEQLPQQAFKSFIYIFQTEKDLCKCFSIQYILYTVFSDKPYLFNDLSIPRSRHLLIIEHLNKGHRCMKRIQNYNTFWICLEKSKAMGGFSYTPLDWRWLFLWLPLTAAIVLGQICVELLATVQFCCSEWLFSFLALNLLMK